MPPKKAVGKAVQKVKKVVEAVRHRPFLKTYINAQMASPAPPLGTQLAARQVRVEGRELCHSVCRQPLAE